MGQNFKMKYVIDSYSLIDYFDGNPAGQKVREYIENAENEVTINILNLAELSSFFARKNIETDKIKGIFEIILSFSKIHNLNVDFSRNAGILHCEMRKKEKNFGLIDAFVLLTSRELKARIITGDEHFRNVKEAILIKN